VPSDLRPTSWPSHHAPNTHIPRDKSAEGLQRAVDAFLSQSGLSAQTRRSYRLTLAALTAALDAAGAEPTAAAIEAAAQLRWGTVAPATWNRHAATVRSFLAYAARHRLLPELRIALDRRREPADRTCALPKAALERLWSRRDIALRATRRCGDCSTKWLRARTRRSPWTSRASTCPTGAPRSAAGTAS
jgi:hypothetical protein